MRLVLKKWKFATFCIIFVISVCLVLCMSGCAKCSVDERPQATETVIVVPEETVEPTCSDEGYSLYKNNLGETYKANAVSALGHDFQKASETSATPVSDGCVTYKCSRCGELQNEVIPKIEVKGIYIPSVKLNEVLCFCDITQENVDNHNVIAKENFICRDSITVAGHDYNSLGIICKVKVGDDIWINISGALKHYVVKVSEEGIDIDQGTDIQGVDTGTRLYKDMLEERTVRLFTCYEKHRWIVIGAEESVEE